MQIFLHSRHGRISLQAPRADLEQGENTNAVTDGPIVAQLSGFVTCVNLSRNLQSGASCAIFNAEKAKNRLHVEHYG